MQYSRVVVEMRNKKSQVEERFTEYFVKWVSELEDLLRQLVAASRQYPDQAELQGVVSRVTSHVKAYYTAKWAAASDDVLAFYSPVWLTPLENSFLWNTGWKPSNVFRLVESLRGRTAAGAASAMQIMSAEQARRIEQLGTRIKVEEERVDREMERQQVAVASRRMVELCRRPDDAAAVEAAVGGLLAGLERVMKAADCVRLRALKGVLDELSPPQCVEFLVAVSMLQLQVRKWGLRRSAKPLPLVHSPMPRTL